MAGVGARKGVKHSEGPDGGMGTTQYLRFLSGAETEEFYEALLILCHEDKQERKASVCLELCLADMLSGGLPREFT